MYRCIVIDDERLARERITCFIDEHVRWQVVAQSGEFFEAQQLIIKHQPDLCFMDINIVGGSGIELVYSLQQLVTCHWVFTTAHSDFALQAFELNALDYLLKPFENSRLSHTLAKAEKLKQVQAKKCKNILAVKSIGAVEFVNVSDIIWIKGAANYVELHCKGRMILHRETLANLEQQLNPDKFVRVHRSAMVNVENVNSLSSELGRFSLLHLSNGDEVKIGQGHRASLFEYFGLDTQH
ncbi:LytR/AlgR family response regulator transcription factor [Paraglaciecola hydrolytica]|uniref:Two-component system response regulator n=1 Tax=Paraglaciecola hydrolytica TaxID=1799789 RepID=A0A148KL85_9ALTE|nr:LytTR family DNA-binding domain-containing protein [Paraglaciecola hydrolytica]KXI27029.1 two-component system response regulator [Paraglaciecola hydrolytica]